MSNELNIYERIHGSDEVGLKIVGINIPNNIYELYKTGYVFLGIINIIVVCLILKNNKKEKRCRDLLIITITITMIGFFISQIDCTGLIISSKLKHENILIFIIRIINYIIQVIIFIKLIINVIKQKKKEENQSCQE